jgi:uncharacterized protein
MNTNTSDSGRIITTGIIGVSIILTAFTLGRALKNRNSAQDAISVTGLGSKDFISDEVYFSGSFSTTAMDAKTALATIQLDKDKVKAFFKAKGFKDSDVNFGGVSFDKKYRNITIESTGMQTKTEQIFDGYEATQTVGILSKKNEALMKQIENVADQTSELVNSGIEFDPNALQYTCSDLPNIKHSLIESASKDARERARKIVQSAKGDMGKLKTASMGVFQITGKGTDEVDDSYGGSNDIHSKEKTARITMRLEYELE